ncbi:MAG: ROK family protein [Fusobacteriaceae bacterium]|nr:ROK family protein [Fusobacteriaceae bacterium]
MNYLVFDIGGTAIKYALMTETCEFLEKGEIPSYSNDFDDFLSKLEDIFNNYSGIKGIAISAPGKIDSDTGYMFSGGALHYNTGKNLVEILKQKWNLPVTIENDGKCGALAEAWKGSLSDCKDAIVIILGTGVGGGIIKNRKLHKGHEFVAGELSFIINNTNAKKGEPLNMFGYSGGVYNGLCKPVAIKKSLPKENVNGKFVFDLANKGDKEVLEILDEYCYKIVLNIHNLQHIYNPEKIAIGGGISSQPILLEYLNNNIEYLQKNFGNMLPLSKPLLTVCKFQNDANLIGALYNFLNKNSL